MISETDIRPVYAESWPPGYKTFFMPNSIEQEIYPAHVKILTIVGILTIISRIKQHLRVLKAEKKNIFLTFYFYGHWKFQALLSRI